ncbi:MarR family transcriptional regulator [Luteibacter yeojuensis]|uniref:MarR family transcriptional regulator n=1 Tax=Luteibacter yeojuensis TaxID=345309 RepID=A0A7X5QSB0_9GAMM|nr:MarR family transcriptional regulator [Luteibacter yeojuensis]NID14430.1 MarR family transcriptional regulator [Luteibacter yeojuensis]
MSKLKPHVEAMYEGVGRVAQRTPEMPVSEVLLVRMLMMTAGALLRSFESKLKPYGLNDSDFRTLMMLYSSEDGTASPGELCSLAEQKPTNMTRIANALAKRDLISRAHATHDRRQVVLRITPAGRRFVTKMLPPLFPPLIESFACFNANERKTFERLLKKLALHIDPLVDPDVSP